MPRFLHIKNPLSKKVDDILDLDCGRSVLDAAKKLWSEEIENFEFPTICLVGDKSLMREEWVTYKPKENEIVSFVTVTGDPISIIIAVVSVVASLALSLMFTVPPPTVGSIPEPDPVYTLRGQTNKVRLGDPIEDHYGRVRIWPSYAAISYNKYIDNEQYLYSLFCIGQGEYDVEQAYIQDTEVENFGDLEIVTYAPGDTVDLFRDNVETSSEVSDVLLEYNTPVGPFTANASGTSADILEVDITLPKGLGYSNDDGGLSSRTVTADFEYRQIDGAGDPIGSWLTLTNFTKTLSTVTPQRFTVSKVVPAGRYEVKATRTNAEDGNYRAYDDIKWEVMRAFLPNVGTYGNVSLLAMRARASNSLNDSSRSQLNLFATRKLPIWNGTTWSAPTATRSAVWAMVNIFRSDNGGNIDDTKLDLADFITKDATLTSEGRNFDWTFDGRGGTWEHAELIARAVRGKPLLQGTKVALALERAKTIPTAVYGPNNIIEGSFEWDIKIYNENEYDGIEIEYTDATTWKPEVIECFLGDSSGDYLDPLKIPGVTDRDFAYREGMFEEAKRRYHRENVTFATGLEGYVPTWGDLIQVNHDVPRWGQGGRVLDITSNIITLDTDVTFGAGTHKILLKTKTGETSGPHTVTAVGGNTKQVDTGTPIDASVFSFGDKFEQPIFLFGVENLEGKFLTVVDVQSRGDEEVEITGVNYDSRVFDEDLNSPAAPTAPPSIIDAGGGLDLIKGLTIAVNTAATEVVVSWNAARAARFFIVQWSDNATTYTDNTQTENSSYTIPISYTPLYIRVAAVTDLGQGPWATTSVTSTETAAATPTVPAGVTVVAGYGQIQVYWANQLGADIFEISINPTAGGTPAVDATTTVPNFILTGLGDTEIQYFQVRAKKTLPSGTILASAWTAQVNGTTAAVIGSTYYTPTEPGDPGKVGAVWFDTSDDDRIYVWNGSAWVDAQYILTVAELTGVIAANEVIANSANIADAVITSAKIASLVASKITSGTIDAATITLNGTGGKIQSNNFVTGTSGFQVLGDGSAEFSDVTIRGNALIEGKIQNSEIIIDEDVYLYRSDALTKPGVPLVSDATDQTESGSFPQASETITFHAWNATGATTASRLLKSNPVVLASFSCTSDASTGPVPSIRSIQYRKNAGSWVTVSSASGSVYENGGDNFSSGSVTFNFELSVTSTDVIDFRGYCDEDLDTAEGPLAFAVQISNW